MPFTTGPPAVKPNWFASYRPFLSPRAFSKNSAALSPSLRLNSQALPWNALEPDFRVALSTAPPARPYSAPKELVSTLISAIASTGGLTTYAVPPRKSTLLVLLSMPSSM